MNAPPLILTLALDEASFARFDALRRRHFPSARNFIPAHLTLFHHLPGVEERRVLEDLRAECAACAPFDLAVTGLRSLGRGVAFTLESRDLGALRSGLVRRWEPWLGPQDRQKHQPHVTVQNKADPGEARALLEALRAGFTPFAVRGEGLHLWRYRGGPWEAAATVAFEG
jgi:hypothetical protein